MSIVPFAWHDRPSLIEHLLPAQKISAEAQKERKAGAGQTLTALGSYWKGRKPLILVKACVLGALLPATDNPELDLDIFEKLMAIDDAAFLRRGFRPTCLDLVKRLHPSGIMSSEEAQSLFEVRSRSEVGRKKISQVLPFHVGGLESLGLNWLQWKESVGVSEQEKWQLLWVRSFGYLERVFAAERPEELAQEHLFDEALIEANHHLGTEATTLQELIQQLGILRFGKPPQVGDAFCGGGSIPFESARLGCSVHASDLNPIACMLTWAGINIIGATAEKRQEIESAQKTLATEVDRKIVDLGVEHDSNGNRAKAFLYCLEVRCPQTRWMVPLAPSWVISNNRNVVAKLIPDYSSRRFGIQIVSGASEAEMDEARLGTVQEGEIVYRLDGETHRTPIKSIRGDFQLPDGTVGNKLRRWEKHDFIPRHEDIFQERLYCVQWIDSGTLGKSKQTTFFKSVTDEDLERERKVEELVRGNLSEWQAQGLIPEMPIEPGNKTNEPIRTRGWSYWHHLFPPRHLLLNAICGENLRQLGNPGSASIAISLCRSLDSESKLTRWRSLQRTPGTTGGLSEKIENVFYNQALNCFYNYGIRSCINLLTGSFNGFPNQPIYGSCEITCGEASAVNRDADIWITDPPYADAIRYEEITEFFIAWLRKNPPVPFNEWVWDSRRSVAIKGMGDDFRREMTNAYRAMSERMPNNGLQIVMFTHQDAGVWADMAAIVWGAGLQVTAAWYIATETSSELKKGGYVQGTVLLVLRKRLQDESTYRDELVQEVRAEVAKQIETMTGLNQVAKGAGRSENLFEDQDLQMAGYAAALRILTGYRKIDGQDMAAEALRPRQPDAPDLVKEIIDFAVQVANEHLVPEGIAPRLWERLTGPERFYLRMLDIEAGGAKKLDNYQNFAKAFRYGDYAATMGSMKANDARLKTALEFKRSEFEGDFGKSSLRAVLFALYELQREVDIDEAISHLRDLVPGYLSRREDLMALASVIASKRETKAPAEAQAARILFSCIKHERLG